MSKIQKITEMIAATEASLLKAKSMLSTNEKSLFGKIAYTHAKERITELNLEKIRELNSRKFEFLEFNLENINSEYGEIPLDIISNIIDPFCIFIEDAALVNKYGGGVYNSIELQKQIHDELNLTMAGLKSGTTKVLIKGNINPDMWGINLLESAFISIFDILKSTDQGVLVVNNNVTSRGLTAIKKIIKKSIELNIKFSINWENSIGKIYHFNGSATRLDSLNKVFEDILQSPPQQANFVGLLHEISLDGYLILVDEKKLPTKFIVPQILIEQIKYLHLGQIITGTASVYKTEFRALKKERLIYEVKSISN